MEMKLELCAEGTSALWTLSSQHMKIYACLMYRSVPMLSKLLQIETSFTCVTVIKLLGVSFHIIGPWPIQNISHMPLLIFERLRSSGDFFIGGTVTWLESKNSTNLRARFKKFGWRINRQLTSPKNPRRRRYRKGRRKLFVSIRKNHHDDEQPN